MSRPKNLNRWTANDARVPSTMATMVAASATLTDVSNASRGPLSCKALVHHWRLNPGGGQMNDFDELNDSTVTTINGM